MYSLLWFHTTCSQTKRQVSVQFIMVSHYQLTNQKTGFCTVCYGFTLPVHKPKDRFLYSLLWFHTTCSQTKRQVSVKFVMVSHYRFTNQKTGFCTVCYGYSLPVHKPKDKFLYGLLRLLTTCSQTKTGFCTVCYGFTLPVHKPKDRFLYSLWFHTTCSQTKRQVSVQFIMVSHYQLTNQKTGFCTVCYGFTLPVHKPKDRFLYSLLWFHTTCSQTKRQVSVQFIMVSHYQFTNQKTGFCTVCYVYSLPVHKPKDKFLYGLLRLLTTCSQTKRQVSVQFVMVTHYLFTNQKTGFSTVCYGCTLPVHKSKDRFLYSLLWLHTTCSQIKTGFCTVCNGCTLPVHKSKDSFLYSLLWLHTTCSQIKRQVFVQFIMVAHYLFTNKNTSFCTACYGCTLPVHKDKFLYSLLWLHTTCSQTKIQASVQLVMVAHYLFTKTSFCTACYGCTLPVHKQKDKFLYSLFTLY